MCIRDSTHTHHCVIGVGGKPIWFEQRYKVLKFDASGEQLDIALTSVNIFEKHPIEYQDYEFGNMCLNEFAMFFEPYYNKNRM